MAARTLNRWAVLWLAACLALGAIALWSEWKAGDVQGPQSLVVTRDQQVWIGVDGELWKLSAQGELLATATVASLGLPDDPANLVRHPGGGLVATVRDDPTLYVLDAATARVTEAVRPQWPGGLERHAGRAIHLAFHADGRVAIATGGGHAVALFDADGRFLARTADDTYRFTNGLWWIGDALWTTDTNRFLLKRLNGRTLAVEETLALNRTGAARFLGQARAHPQAASGGETMAALVRFHNGMIRGQVVRIDAQGRAQPMSARNSFEPRDIDWLAGDLLASDGITFSLRRWSGDGAELPAFGDAATRARLQGRLAAKQRLHQRYKLALPAAICCFAVAMGFVVLAQRRRQPAAPPVDASLLGTPSPGRRRTAWLRLRLYAPVLAILGLMAVLRYSPLGPWLDRDWSPAAMLAWIVVPILLLPIAATLILRRQRRQTRDPQFEPLFNAMAVSKLRRSNTLREAIGPDDAVCEVFMLHAGRGLQTAVLTRSRLLLFRSTLTSDRLDETIELTQVRAASTQRGSLRDWNRWSPVPWLRGLWGWIEIGLADGRVIAGGALAPVAARVVDRLAASRAGERDLPVPRPAAAPPEPLRPREAMAAVWASALVPGLGQWMQRRGLTALSFFVPWLVLLFFVAAPVGYKAWGPRAEVSLQTLATVVAAWLFYAGWAAWDAWRMGGARR